MFLITLFIRYLLDVEFCGNTEGCVECPLYGKCDGRTLVCDKGYTKIRYECADDFSLPYSTQELSMQIELFLAKRALLTQRYSITEFDLIEELNADHIVFYKVMEMIKLKQSNLLSWRKDAMR